jgi:hypothetical protein
MKWRFAGSSLLLCAALSSVGAQQVQPDPLVKLNEWRPKVQALIDSARAERLPWNALRLKALEGVNKKPMGISNKAIYEALLTFYRRLEQSRAALGPMATDQEIEAGASVLAAQVSTEDLAKFRVSGTGRSPMAPLTYLADLIDKHQVPKNEAIEAFTKLWKDGAAESDFDGLWRLVDQDILGGVAPRAALQSRMKSLPPRAKPPVDQEMENPRS